MGPRERMEIGFHGPLSSATREENERAVAGVGVAKLLVLLAFGLVARVFTRCR